MRNLAEEITNELLSLIQEIEDTYNSNFEMIGKCDKEIQDLMHEIELSKFNVVEGYYLAKQLQEVRQRRRNAKNENELLWYLHQDTFVKTPAFKNSLLNASRNIKRKQSEQETREYNPRILENLKICQKRAWQSKHLRVLIKSEVVIWRCVTHPLI